jgi:hypothetical protein
MGAMAGDDTLRSAAEELYALDPDDFTERRGELAARARRDGDAVAAKAIGALRRPTKAAAILNRLAREEPDTVAGLAELGAGLRRAQRALDGARLRELTQQRRKLIDAAARTAFRLSGLADPPAAVRSEVASTLEAALADPDVADQFATGTLVRSADWSGFGDAGPTLAAVAPLPSKRGPSKSGPAKSGPAKKAARTTDGPAKRSEPTERERAEQRRQERLSAAQGALDEATAQLRAADEAEQERREQVDLLTEQLADARRRLDEARLDTRRAKGQVREAQRRVDRARD